MAKERIKTHIGSADIYAFYRRNTDNKTVSRSTFSKITDEFNDAIMSAVIYEGYEFALPFRLGHIRIRKHKPKLRYNEDGSLDKTPLHPNWKETKKLWEENPEAKERKQLVFHTNPHTDGYQYKFFWHKKHCNIKNHTSYCFIPSRANKRKLAALLKNPDMMKQIQFFE